MRYISAAIACVAIGFAGCGTRTDAPPAGATLDGPVITVTASYPGASAQVVAETVAAPIEQQINGVEGMVLLESECHNDGTFTARVRFAAKTDLAIAQVLVQNRVSLAEPALPAVVRRQGMATRRGDPSRLPALWVAVTSPGGTFDAMYLNNYAELRVRDELARVTGVAEVRTVSRSEIAVRVWPDADKLAARNLTAQDVVGAVERSIRVEAGQPGRPEVGKAPLLTFTYLGGLRDVENLSKIILKATADGEVIRLGDVARVELGAKTDGVTRLGGKPAALVAVSVQPGEVADLRKALGKLAETAPKGTEVQLVADLTADRFVAVEVRLPEVTTSERTQEVVASAEKCVQSLPGAPECVAFDDGVIQGATLLLKLAAKDGPSAADVRKSLAGLRNASVRVSDLSGGRPFPVRIALTDAGQHGEGKLREWGDAVVKRLAADGVALDPAVEPGAPRPVLSLDIDREKAEKLGVKVSDIADTLKAFVGPAPIGDFDKFGRFYHFRVHPDGKGIEPDDVTKLQVRGDNGRMIPLGTIVTVRQATASQVAVHVNMLPALRITADAAPGKSAAEVTAKGAAVAEEVRKQLKLPDKFGVVNLSDPKPR